MRVERAGSEPIDPTALSKALRDVDDAGRSRERTPGASPSRKRQRIYGDRSVGNTIHPCDGAPFYPLLSLNMATRGWKNSDQVKHCPYSKGQRH